MSLPTRSMYWYVGRSRVMARCVVLGSLELQFVVGGGGVWAGLEYMSGILGFVGGGCECFVRSMCAVCVHIASSGLRRRGREAAGVLPCISETVVVRPGRTVLGLDG